MPNLSLTKSSYARVSYDFGLDFLFRALCATLESHSIKLRLEDVKFIRRKLDTFIERHDREVVLAKYAVDFV